jgi:hypothetical protein
MLFHLSVFLHTVLFIFGLAVTAKYGDSLLFYAWTIIALVLVTVRIVRSFVSESGWVFFLPVLLTASSVALLAFISKLSEQRLFLALAMFAYYTLLLGLYRLSRAPQDVTARAMVSMNAMITMFFYFSVLYGLYINFTVPLWLFMVLYGLGAFGTLAQYLRILTTDKKRISLYSLIGALALSELAWVVNFLPFGYLTSGVIVLMFFFVLFDLAQSEILQVLSKKRALTHIGIFVALLIMVLWSSRWLPVA